MVPRWHFVLHGLLWGAATVIVGLLAVYLLSFIMFAMHESGLIFAPFFGWSGFILFVVSSPWLLIGLLGLFLLILYILVSHYSFSYQKPLVYSMVILVLAVIAVSSLIHQTNLHGRAGDFVERHPVPGLSPLYRGVGEQPPRNIMRGTVGEVGENEFTLIEEMGEEYIVRLSERTKMPYEMELVADQAVMVFGPLMDEVIEAFGVRIDDGTLPPPRGPKFQNRDDSSLHKPGGNMKVENIEWIIAPANPEVNDPDDYKQYEQAVAINITTLGGMIKNFELGTAYGCNDQNSELVVEDSKKVYGKVNCYFAATGANFIAYEQEGKFMVEKFTDDASGVTDGKTEILLEW